MSTSDPLTYRPSTGDRIGIIIFMVIGLALVAWSAIASVLYIAEVVGGKGIKATVSLVDTTVEVPVGSSGASVPMLIDSASVSADHLSGTAFGTAIISAVLGFIVVATIVTCLTLLARNSLRGKIFSRGNTRLVVAAGMTALMGFGMSSVLDRMVGNEVLLSMHSDALENVAVLTAEPMPFVLLAFAFGIVATAYTIGAKMQRETEGLV
ncbi:MAG: hypothetical protein ACTIJ6_00415 [Leucobacter sp.]